MALLPDSFTVSGIDACRRQLPYCLVLVAENDGQLEGFAAWQETAATRGELAWLAVRPAAQGRGLGTELAREVEAEARSAGLLEIAVKTLAEGPESPEYERARRFYEKLGYTLAEVIDPYPGWEPGNPCAVYRKPLATTT